MSIISAINQYNIQTSKEEIDIIKYNIYLIINYINSTHCANASINDCKQLFDNIQISNSTVTYYYLYSLMIIIIFLF